MKINNWKSNEKVLIIAEIGNNHEGSFMLAEEIIGLAHQSGVDAVKFQTFKTEFYVGPNNVERYNQLKSYELSQDEFTKLAKLTRDLGMIFISTPFDIESAEFLSGIVDAYKISSGDNNFYPMISHAALKNKPIILSSGYADVNQLKKSKKLIENVWKKQKIKQDLAILHCVSAYPVKEKYANLKAISTLNNSLECTIGYSDHTMGNEAAIASVCLGARIIEKHFTIDNNFSKFRDHKISADPTQMKSLVKDVRKIELMLGDGIKVAQKPELESVNIVRRSIVAKIDMKKKHIIRENDITWIRGSGYYSPGDEGQLIGKEINKNIDAFHFISKDDLIK